MAKATNIVTTGIKGKVDVLVFKTTKSGKPIVTKAPHKSTKPPTAAQIAVRQHFQEAVFYGKGQIADPASKAEYQNEVTAIHTSAMSVAIADFHHAPDIHEVDFSAYQGNPGNTIRTIVTDDFKVKQVRVTISNADGSLVETGLAVQNPVNPLEWNYNTTAVNPSIAGDRISIQATDKPGNLTEAIRNI